MASLQDRLQDSEYKRWIKSGLCLSYTKQGIEKFTDDRSKKTHAFIKAAVENQAIVKTPDGGIQAMNKICDNAKVIKIGNKWSLGCCKDCEIYLKEIQQLRKQSPFRFEQSNWENSDVLLWPSEPWEIAKVYMNKGQKSFKVQKSAKETDLSGLLNFIDHCSVPWVDIHSKDTITKVREARNSTMHSASMKMSHAEFLTHTDAMIALLQDPLFMDKIEEAQDAVKEIQKIVRIDFIISSTDELKVLTNKTSSLQEQNDRLQEEVNALKIKHTELEHSSDLRIKTIRSLTETETGQREDAIKSLKAEMNEKERRLKKFSTELILLKKLIKQDKNLYRKMDIRMKNMESSFEKTATEFKEVKQSHQTLFEQVQRIQQEMQMVQLSNLSYKNEEQGIAHLHKLEEDNAILKEKMAEKLEELEEIRCKNRDLESRMSAVSKSMGGIQDNSKLLKAEKSNQELVAVNEKLTTEVSQLQNELRQIHERGERMECTNSTCKSCIEALEYTSELLKSENEWLWSKHAMKESKASLRAFEERNAVLEAKLEVSASEKRELDTYIEELKNDLDVERNIITQYENKMHGLSADMKKVSSEKEIQQEKHKVEEAILEKQISILHEEKSKIEIELNNRNTQIQTLTLENAKLKQDLEKDSNILYEYRLQAESNIKSLNERVQYLQRNIEKTDQQQIEAKSTFESMNLRKIQLEIDLAKKEENFQRVMQENAVLKAKEAKEIDAILATPINVRLSSDEATPCISGAEFMSSGYLVICDRNNMKVKVLDNSFVVTGSVTLPSEPMDVSEINSNRAVVTLPELKQCMVIEILPTSLGVSPYNLCDKELWGIHMFGAEIYAVYENELNKRRGIIVLDFQKRKIKAVFDSPKIFTNPENVAVNNFGIAVIAVSDHASNSVTFMTTDGTVNCQYTDSDLQRPGGMCFDKRLNVIVCGSESKNLQVISLFGEKLKTILMPKNPISIAYREDDVIVVGFNNDNLLLLDLKILLDKQDGGKI